MFAASNSSLFTSNGAYLVFVTVALPPGHWPIGMSLIPSTSALCYRVRLELAFLPIAHGNRIFRSFDCNLSQEFQPEQPSLTHL